MRIIIDHPPNIESINKAFHVKDRYGILYTYGDSIYSPSGEQIPEWLLRHEEVHSQRQYDLGKKVAGEEFAKGSDEDYYKLGAEIWWDTYITDEKFRLEEELAAHRVEYQTFKEMHNRHETRGHLIMMAERLSSDMYGNCTTKKKAKELIKDVQEEESEQHETPETPEENLRVSES